MNERDLPGAADSSHGHGPHDHGAHTGEAKLDSYQRFTSEMHSSMKTMMEDMHRDPPSGDADIDFLAMMIPHHWGAVEMARLVLAAGKDPLTRALAEAMIADQNGEIAGMRGRLATLRRDSSAAETDYPQLDGNRGPS